MHFLLLHSVLLVSIFVVDMEALDPHCSFSEEKMWETGEQNSFDDKIQQHTSHTLCTCCVGVWICICACLLVPGETLQQFRTSQGTQ